MAIKTAAETNSAFGNMLSKWVKYTIPPCWLNAYIMPNSGRGLPGLAPMKYKEIPTVPAKQTIPAATKIFPTMRDLRTGTIYFSTKSIVSLLAAVNWLLRGRFPNPQCPEVVVSRLSTRGGHWPMSAYPTGNLALQGRIEERSAKEGTRSLLS